MLLNLEIQGLFASNRDNNLVFIRFLPNQNDKLVLLSKKYLYRLSSVDQGQLRVDLSLPLPHIHASSFVWLDNRRGFIGDDFGRVIIFDTETSQIQREINVNEDLGPINRMLQARTRFIEDSSNKIEDSLNPNEDNKNETDSSIHSIADKQRLITCSIRQIVKISDGFICVVGKNKIVVYCLNGLGEYQLRHAVQLPHERNNSSKLVN